MTENTPNEILNQMRARSMELAQLYVYGAFSRKIRDALGRYSDIEGDVMTIDRSSFNSFTGDEMNTKYDMHLITPELNPKNYPETDADDLIFSFHCDSSEEANYVEEQLYAKFRGSLSNILILTSGGVRNWHSVISEGGQDLRFGENVYLWMFNCYWAEFESIEFNLNILFGPYHGKKRIVYNTQSQEDAYSLRDEIQKMNERADVMFLGLTSLLITIDYTPEDKLPDHSLTLKLRR